ncbi:MAG: hypothetical protein ACP5N6_08970, partial [Anaerolineae bacterium]
ACERGTPRVPNSRLLSIYRGLRWPLLLLAVTGLLLFAAWRLTRPDIIRWDDTVEYWAAGRLNATGQNPYDPHLLLRLTLTSGAGRLLWAFLRPNPGRHESRTDYSAWTDGLSPRH